MLELSPEGFTSAKFNKVSIGGIERTISRQVMMTQSLARLFLRAGQAFPADQGLLEVETLSGQLR